MSNAFQFQYIRKVSPGQRAQPWAVRISTEWKVKMYKSEKEQEPLIPAVV